MINFFFMIVLTIILRLRMKMALRDMAKVYLL